MMPVANDFLIMKVIIMNMGSPSLLPWMDDKLMVLMTTHQRQQQQLQHGTKLFHAFLSSCFDMTHHPTH